MTKRSAGIACEYGDGSHGYAVRTAPDEDTMMCEECADIFDTLADAQDAWDKVSGGAPALPSDASNVTGLYCNDPIIQPACSDCMLAHSIIEVNEAADNSYDGSDEVSNAYDHLANHRQEVS